MRFDTRKLALFLAASLLTLGSARVAAAQGQGHGHGNGNGNGNGRDRDRDRREQRDDDRDDDRDNEHGNGRDRGERHDNGRAHEKGWMPPGQAKKMRSSDDAVGVTRDVLHSHGYEVVRVEPRGAGRVVYYRRVRVGKFTLKQPVTKMYLTPQQDHYVIERAPNKLVAEMRAKLAE